MLETREREIKAKYTLLWRMNCEQLSEYDHIITVKEDEIVALKVHISFLERNQHSRPVTVPSRSVSFSSEIHSRPVALHETALTPHPGTTGHITPSRPGQSMRHSRRIERESSGAETSSSHPPASPRGSPLTT